MTPEGINKDIKELQRFMPDNAFAKKTLELKAGEVLITEASKKLAESKKEIQDESREKKEEKEEYRDTSSLSEQSKWFGIERKAVENIFKKWALEMEAELWEAFLNWFPKTDQSLHDQLEELSDLYLALVKSVLIHTVGKEQQEQMLRLETVLSEKLNLLIQQSLKELMEFTGEFGTEEIQKNIKSSLYRQITGDTLSRSEIDAFYSKDGARKNGALNKNQSGASLYYPSGKNAIKLNQNYHERINSEALLINRENAIGGYSKGGEYNVGYQGNVAVYSEREMELANQFVQYITGSGNLFENRGVTAQNSEVFGVLAAVTAMKGNIFFADKENTGLFGSEVKGMLSRFIDFYLIQAEQQNTAGVQMARGGGSGSQRSAYGGLYDVYYYMMNIYSKTKEPSKAVMEGIQYAAQMFEKKKMDAAFSKDSAYGKEAGFFEMFRKDQTGDWSVGRQILEKDWEEFLRMAGWQNRKNFYLLLEKYSPWGTTLSAGKKSRLRKHEIDKMLIFGCGAVLAAVLLYMLFGI